MKAVIRPLEAAVAPPPVADLPDDAIERQFGVIAHSPTNRGIAVGQRHAEVMQRSADAHINAQFTGYRMPLGGVQWAFDEQDGINWIILPIEQDRSFDEGLMMPRHIRRNINRARRAKLFDDYYIAHAWDAGDADTDTRTLIPAGETAADLVPWDKLRSPRATSTLKILDRAARFDQLLWRGLLRVINGVGIGVTVTLGLLIATALTAGIIATAAAVITPSMLLVAVAVGGVLIMASLATSGARVDPKSMINVDMEALRPTRRTLGDDIAWDPLDPIVYGVVYAQDAQGNRVAMLYRLGQWDIM